jgi:carbonic anhydrase/acetyltransferase-like protein (isoleucine patch superfamily)
MAVSHKMVRRGSIYAAESAVIVGDVRLGPGSNLWHHTVCRGDVAPIRLGERVNVQDGAILHCKLGVTLEVASEVAIGHQAVVHCKRVGSRTLIGTRATVLDDAEIGEDCLIAAGALVAPGTVIPDGSVVMGMPGKVVRSIRPEERAYIERVVRGYLELARRHAEGEFPEAFPVPDPVSGR